MKNSLFVLLFLLINVLPNFVLSQTRQTIRTSERSVNVGEMAENNFQYLLPEKIAGIVYFNNGDSAIYKMNYNILLDEIHFISLRGDIRALKETASVKKIKLDNHIFIDDNYYGYIESLYCGETSLYMKRQININTIVIQRGAYGGTNHTSSIQPITINQGTLDYQKTTVYIDNSNIQELEITLRYNEYFIFETEEKKSTISNRRQLLGLFPHHKSELRSYIRQNNINFSCIVSLMSLAGYINNLAN